MVDKTGIVMYDVVARLTVASIFVEVATTSLMRTLEVAPSSTVRVPVALAVFVEIRLDTSLIPESLVLTMIFSIVEADLMVFETTTAEGSPDSIEVRSEACMSVNDDVCKSLVDVV